MQIQRLVSWMETFITRETRSGTRSDGAGGTEDYCYVEDVEHTEVVCDYVTEEVPDPPPAAGMADEEALDEDEEDPMTGEEAIAVLDRDFEVFDTANGGWFRNDDKISTSDLETVAANADGKFTDEQQEAAQTLLASPAYLSFVDTAAGNGSVDGTIGRNDVTAAVKAIASGNYLDELLDTAAGMGSPDGFIGNADVRAALADPSISEAMKDTLRLMLDSSEGGDGLYDVIAEISVDEIDAISALVQTSEFEALTPDERELAADAIRDSGGDASVTADIQTLIQSADFSGGTAEERTEALSRIAILNSTEFAALPASDQALIRQTLTDADAASEAVAADLLSLVQNENFDALPAATKTSILSQASNYPTSVGISNLERLADEDWFQNQDLADQQRSAKLVAHLSANMGTGEQQTIIENTLDRLLSPTSDYELAWESITASPGNVTYGRASGTRLTLNEDLFPADNNPVGTGSDELHMSTHTVAHEISHLVNSDATARTFEYLNMEYRAWYIGEIAENGTAPTNEEAMERWEYFLSPSGGYADYSIGNPTNPGALMNPAESPQIFAMLSTLSGLTVDSSNYLTVMGDPSSWTTNPSDPAPDTDFNAGDDLDN